MASVAVSFWKKVYLCQADYFPPSSEWWALSVARIQCIDMRVFMAMQSLYIIWLCIIVLIELIGVTRLWSLFYPDRWYRE